MLLPLSGFPLAYNTGALRFSKRTLETTTLSFPKPQRTSEYTCSLQAGNTKIRLLQKIQNPAAAVFFKVAYLMASS